MTPEGKIKAGIRALLRNFGPAVYVYMPVPNGYGGTTLDYLGACCGIAFAIEAKRKGAKPTPRQEATIAQMKRAGIRVFVIDGADGLQELEEWLLRVVKATGNLSLSSNVAMVN